ncbi:glycoside hydrolase family 43 protein [Gonapodya prolifera JEL478]|uniref:Glycoside hydrolase family 43 protein n=1 Tax=Gonapodya prolifera (strain JEL478) TaxID=1344416 RepID=A0A139AU93_GONPJ|nr:glycoside hydrolase family 43 protein [Gonapodya prolifera JEL478]|eukprot:KXS20288.1 glycoside hydrolase family 43 protein [Gonapodya prolifera JEL478]
MSYSVQLWGKGFENHRVPDLSNGFFRNPVFPGDHPDPSILKDGDDYYMVHSSFDVYPGLIIYQSRDLINWVPITAALTKWIGSVWASYLTKFGETYYIYIPARSIGKPTNYVISAPSITGPWSDPIDMHAPLGPDFPAYIDPSHVVGEDGKRYLFVAGTHYMQLTDDGLSIIPETFKLAVKPCPMPDEWLYHSPAPEGPKVARIGEYFFLTTAQGGTAGPPTSHFVFSYRSKSIHGPWEFSPRNPVMYTTTPEDNWWSKGHGTLVQGPKGGSSEWYLVFHGYEKEYYNLGRHTLLSPVVFTEDGWWYIPDLDFSKPLPMPIVLPGEKKFDLPYSDDFSTNKFGIQWGFYISKPVAGPLPNADRRPRYELTPSGKPSLVLNCKGDSPANADPLTFRTGDYAYTISVKVTLLNPETAAGGLLLYYSSRMYAGLSFDGSGSFFLHRYGTDRPLPNRLKRPTSLMIRLVLNYKPMVLTMYTCEDSEGKEWRRFETQVNVDSYHHNSVFDFMSLRPALYASGQGEVRFENFTYEINEVKKLTNDIGLLRKLIGEY